MTIGLKEFRANCAETKIHIPKMSYSVNIIFKDLNFWHVNTKTLILNFT